MSVTFAQQVETRSLVYIVSGFLALAALTTLLIGPRNALKARGSAKLPIQSLGTKPVLQIELAWNESQLSKIFLPGDTKANLRDAAAGNNLDTFLFIPSYTGLLMTLGLLLGRFTRFSSHTALLIVILLVPLIALSDWSENFGIARAIHHMEAQGTPEAGDATKISTPSLIKWTLTALVLAAFGIEAFNTNNWKWLPIAAALVLLSASIVFVLCSYARERWF